MKKISIIIPTYKRHEKIKKVISMALGQSYLEKEIIVIDDNGLGSECQIKTEANLKDLIVEEKIIYYPLDRNSGACTARNIGVQLATGELLAFFDDDDEYDQNKLKYQAEDLKNNPDCGVSVCGLTILSDKGARDVFIHIPKVDQYNIFLKNLNKNFGLPLTLIYKNKFLECGGLDHSFKSAQDMDFNIRVLQITKACFLQKSLIKLDDREVDRISSNYHNKLESYERIMNKYRDTLKEESFFFLNHRILQLAYSTNNSTAFSLAYNYMKQVGKLSVKYRVMQLSWNVPHMRKLIANIINY